MERVILQELLETTRGRHLDLKPSRRVRSRRFGDYRSAFVGDEGIEFAGLREAEPHDNPRRIHPRATSQSEMPILRQFTPPREAGVLVLIDLGPSMYVRKKMHAAFCAAALLARFALHAHMPFGIWTVGSKYDIAFKQKIGNVPFQNVMNLLMDVVSGDVDDSEARSYHIREPLASLRQILSQGSLFFPISDFLHLEDGDFLTEILHEARGFDVTPIIVQDEMDYTFPTAFGRYGRSIAFYDVETKIVQEVWLNRKTADARRVEHERRFKTLLRRFHHAGFSYAHLDSFDFDVRDISRKLQEALL